MTTLVLRVPKIDIPMASRKTFSNNTVKVGTLELHNAIARRCVESLQALQNVEDCLSCARAKEVRGAVPEWYKAIVDRAFCTPTLSDIAPLAPSDSISPARLLDRLLTSDVQVAKTLYRPSPWQVHSLYATLVAGAEHVLWIIENEYTKTAKRPAALAVGLGSDALLALQRGEIPLESAYPTTSSPLESLRVNLPWDNLIPNLYDIKCEEMSTPQVYRLILGDYL